MQTALKIAAGVDDSQSVVLRDHGGMTTTVLTRQQCWRGIASILQIGDRERGWRSPRIRFVRMGCRELCPFRTQYRHRAMFVSRSTCTAVPSCAQDETLVQQPSSYLPEGASLGSDRLRVEI
jgi:hypothetical protein